MDSIKLLPQRHPNLGLAAFIDFHDVDAAVEARNTEIKIKVNDDTIIIIVIFRFNRVVKSALTTSPLETKSIPVVTTTVPKEMTLQLQKPIHRPLLPTGIASRSKRSNINTFHHFLIYPCSVYTLLKAYCVSCIATFLVLDYCRSIFFVLY